jgi:hypothetical protein
MKKLMTGVLLLLLISGAASARQLFDTSKIYFGGGLSSNDLSGFDNAIGWQIFGGLPLDLQLGTGDLSIEVGYMDSGEFEQNIPPFGTITTEAKGIWATGVGKWPVGKNLSIIGRLGFDFGDDDGLMLGGGVGYSVAKNLDLRGEYVIRDNIDSLQFNVVYYH